MDKTAKFSLAARFAEPGELEAFAAEKDPYKTWVHFVFTDDKPNMNGQRVPKDEFTSLMKTATHMPIKKLAGGVGDTHDGAIPMGAIAKTKIVEDGSISRIEGLAALWDKEFPQDIEYLRQRFTEGESINFSWEIGFTEMVDDPEFQGIKLLKGCSTRAATIVAMPAYSGRTPALAMASEDIKKRLEKLEQFFNEEIVTDEYIFTGMRADISTAATDDDKSAQKARSSKYGISIRSGGNVTKPKEYSHLSDSQFADPVNYAYPIDKEHIRAALSYWGKPANRAKYDSKSQGVISKRISAAARRYGINLGKNGGESSMDLKELKERFVGLEPADQVQAALESVEDLFKEFEEIKTERDELLDEKKTRDEEDARAQLLRSRLSVLKEAGIEYDEEELESEAKALIEMTEEAFKLFVSKLSDAMKKAPKDADAGVRIPQSTGNTAVDSRLTLIRKTLTSKEDKEEGDK